MLHNYKFVIPGVLAGSALPGYLADLEEDLEQAKADGITAVVTLTEPSLDREVVKGVGLEYLHLPVEDYGPPTVSQMEQFARFVDTVRAGGGAVLVHCRAGIGRTGTMLAAYLVTQDQTAEQAMAQVRRARPGSIETLSQERAVMKFEEVLNKYPR